jgi:predicted enzyme related to lactoylglutathione lyase
VMRVDDAFAAITAAGAEIGEAPYSIGRIARISFVRDPHGNWIEVAQRAALAGPWWDD